RDQELDSVGGLCQSLAETRNESGRGAAYGGSDSLAPGVDDLAFAHSRFAARRARSGRGRRVPPTAGARRHRRLDYLDDSDTAARADGVCDFGCDTNAL